MKGDKLKLQAYAKINLTLDITGVRPDGYHEVEMIMQTVSANDTVFISRADKGINMTCNRSWLPTDDRNLAVKAAKVFCEYTGIAPAFSIHINKYIPVAAGLAGGSADAAAVMVGLNRLTDAGLNLSELCEIGGKIGADVPFCISGGTALAEGIGEKLTALPPIPNCVIVLAKPKISVSTPAAYKQFDECETIRRPDTKGCINAVKSGSIADIASCMHNVFEDALKIDEVEELKRIMLENGAVISQMTGSGPTVFGIFENRRKAENACEKCREVAPFACVCHPTKTRDIN